MSKPDCECGWMDRETGKAYRMGFKWKRWKYWLQRYDLYFYKRYINPLWPIAILMTWFISLMMAAIWT